MFFNFSYRNDNQKSNVKKNKKSLHTFKKYYLLFRQLKQVTVFAQKMSNQIAMGNCQPFGMTETLVRK